MSSSPIVTNDGRRKAALRQAMQTARETTLRLLEQTPERYFRVRVHDFYSPVGWHFGHIGMTEEAWAVCSASGRLPLDSGLSFLFANIPENPKDDRVHLPSRREIIDYLAATRASALGALDIEADLNSYRSVDRRWLRMGVCAAARMSASGDDCRAAPTDSAVRGRSCRLSCAACIFSADRHADDTDSRRPFPDGSKRTASLRQ